MKLFQIVIFSLSLAGCVSSEPVDREHESMRRRALTEIDVYKCVMEGKAVAAVGMFATPACISIYSDGGTACSDKSECEGECFVEDRHELGEKIKGVCQRSEKDAFGCYSIISSGEVVKWMCQD